MKLEVNKKLQQAITAHKDGESQEAERLYREILKTQPMHPDANHNLGVLVLSKNRMLEALSLFKIATEANPKIERFWISFANVLIKEKKYEEAEKSFKKVIELNPDNAQAHNIRGTLVQILGKLDEAEESYRKAIELKPDYAEAFFNLGNELNRLARLDEAEASLKKAIELKPDYTDAYNNLSLTLGRLGRSEEAVAILRKVIGFNSYDAKVHINLGNILQSEHKLDEAEKSYRKAIELKPDFAVGYNNLGTVLHKSGRLDQAEKSYRKAIELKPDYAEAYTNLGNTFKELNRLDESEVSYKKAMILQSDFIAVTSSVNKGDWQNSKDLLAIACTNKIVNMEEYINEFIALWCLYCGKLLANGDIKKFSQIFIKLLIMGERNRDLNSLIILFFDKVDIDTVLELVEPHDKILIKVSYCQYKFVNKNFLQSEKLASSNIQDATNFISSIETEDLGWLVVRRSLALYENKNAAREKLNNLLFKLIEIK